MAQPDFSKIKNDKLRNILWQIHKTPAENAQAGNGATGAALRKEKITGNPVGRQWHKQKVNDNIRALQNWVKDNKNTAARTDIDAAENYLRDLNNAIKLKE